MSSSHKKNKTAKENNQKVAPLTLKNSKEYAAMVDKWLKRKQDYRTEATHASFVLLMSDFLFSNIQLPEKWLSWVYELKMIGLSAEPKRAKSKDLQSNTLEEYQIIVVKMLFAAQSALKKIAHERYNLIGLMEIITKIEHEITNVSRVIGVAKGQEQIKKLCKRLLSISSSYSEDDQRINSLDMNLYEFASCNERMLMAALLVGRSLTTTIIRLGSSDNCDVVAETNDLFTKFTPETSKLKDAGNKFFQDEEYNKALEVYSQAISYANYNAVLYGNRCQTALRIKQYKLAICDGYRAIALKPTWGKAYYRQAEGFKGANQVDAALACNFLGLQLCAAQSEIEDLKKQKQKLESFQLHNGLNSETALSASEPIKKSKKVKNGKKSGKGAKGNSEEQVPSLMPDNDSMKDLSDSGLNVGRYFKKSLSNPPKRSTKRKRKSSIDSSNSSITNEKADGKESMRSNNDGGFNHEKLKRKQASKKNGGAKQSQKQGYKLEKGLAKQKPKTPQDVFLDHSVAGSIAYEAKEYLNAAREYEIAIDLLPTDSENWKVSKIDRFVLTYTRGLASLKSNVVIEIARSLDIFATLIPTGEVYDESFHPMAFYRIAFAQFKLNNYALMEEPILKGRELLEAVTVTSLKHPGVDTVIPESEKETLLSLLDELLENMRFPVIPDAVCFYNKCEKEFRNDSSAYGMFEKEISRKEIYCTDLNFEGFMNIFCSWDCVTFFHYKCWARFKHTTYAKSGDKEILNLRCFTDSCDGVICRITMLDKDKKFKKDLKLEKSTKKKEEPYKAPTRRMSKSEQNLMRRRKQLEETKDKKVVNRLEATGSVMSKLTTQKTKKETVKITKNFTDIDVANATVIKREDNEHVSKTRNKNKPKKRHGNIISLQEFLKGQENGVSAADVERALANLSPDFPFFVPDSFREEIQLFESEMSDEDIVRATYLYEYFEDFFKENGPVKVDDSLLLEQHLMLSDEMKVILRKSNGVVAFLCRSKDRFLVVPPYIGLPEQEAALVQLAHDFNKTLQAKNSSNRTSSSHTGTNIMDTLDTDFDNPASLSDFARDVHEVGDVPMSDIADLTGSASVSATGPRVLPGVISLTSNMGEASHSNREKIISKKSSSKPFENHIGDGDAKGLSLCNVMDEFLSSDRTLSNNVDLDTFSTTESESSNSTRGQDSTIGYYGDGNPSSADILRSISSKRSEEYEESSDEETIDDDDDDDDDDDEESSDDEDWKDDDEQDEGLASCGTQTDTFYQEDFAKLKRTNEFLQEKIDDLLDKCSNSRLEISTKNRKISDLSESLQTTTKKARGAAIKADSEIKKMTKDRLILNDNIRDLKAQLKEARLKQSDLEKKVKDKECDVDRLSVILQEQRGKLMEEKVSVERERDGLKVALQQANKRCVDSELKTLQNEESFSLKILFKARSECEKFVVDFHKLVRHHAGDVTSQTEAMNAYMQWQEKFETCAKNIEQVKQQYALHAEMVLRGKTLSDLPPIQVPDPPSPGPNIQQYAMNALLLPGTGAQSASLNVFPRNAASSSALLSSNVEPPVVLTAPRVPQPPIGTGKQVVSSVKPAPSPGTVVGQAATPPVSGPTSSQPKGSFEKIMAQLIHRFPTVTRPELASCIRTVRENNNNSLTGLSFDDIVQQASLIVEKRKLGSKQVSSALSVSSRTTSSTISASAAPWTFSRSTQPKNTSSTAFTNEDPCVICHDSLQLMKVRRLACGHIFHDECVTKWLERNRTCPNCRDYAIDTSEYPSLSSNRR